MDFIFYYLSKCRNVYWILFSMLKCCPTLNEWHADHQSALIYMKRHRDRSRIPLINVLRSYEINNTVNLDEETQIIISWECSYLGVFSYISRHFGGLQAIHSKKGKMLTYKIIINRDFYIPFAVRRYIWDPITPRCEMLRW